MANHGNRLFHRGSHEKNKHATGVIHPFVRTAVSTGKDDIVWSLTRKIAQDMLLNSSIYN